MTIIVTSQYGRLARGRHSARNVVGSSTIWAEKDECGRLVIDEPGKWILHCSDGFRREARAILVVDENGDWEMSGDTRRFDVVKD